MVRQPGYSKNETNTGKYFSHSFVPFDFSLLSSGIILEACISPQKDEDFGMDNGQEHERHEVLDQQDHEGERVVPKAVWKVFFAKVPHHMSSHIKGNDFLVDEQGCHHCK